MPQFHMLQRQHSVRRTFDVTDGAGDARYRLAAPWFRVPQTFVLQRPEGEEEVQIQRKLFTLRTTMELTRRGRGCASVRRALLPPWRRNYVLSDGAGHRLVASGDIAAHEYEMRRNGETVARVSRRWRSTRDGYGVEVREGEDAPFLLAVAVAIDEMAHDPLGEDRTRPAR